MMSRTRTNGITLLHNAYALRAYGILALDWDDIHHSAFIFRTLAGQFTSEIFMFLDI